MPRRSRARSEKAMAWPAEEQPPSWGREGQQCACPEGTGLFQANILHRGIASQPKGNGREVNELGRAAWRGSLAKASSEGASSGGLAHGEDVVEGWSEGGAAAQDGEGDGLLLGQGLDGRTEAKPPCIHSLHHAHGGQTSGGAARR